MITILFLSHKYSIIKNNIENIWFSSKFDFSLEPIEGNNESG